VVLSISLLGSDAGEKYILEIPIAATMGSIRPSNIKRVARALVDSYPDKFSGDFEKNKIMVSKLTDVQTKRLRNMLAGYVTRYWKIKMRKEEGS